MLNRLGRRGAWELFYILLTSGKPCTRRAHVESDLRASKRLCEVK